MVDHYLSTIKWLFSKWSLWEGKPVFGVTYSAPVRAHSCRHKCTAIYLSTWVPQGYLPSFLGVLLGLLQAWIKAPLTFFPTLDWSPHLWPPSTLLHDRCRACNLLYGGLHPVSAQYILVIITLQPVWVEFWSWHCPMLILFQTPSFLQLTRYVGYVPCTDLNTRILGRPQEKNKIATTFNIDQSTLLSALSAISFFPHNSPMRFLLLFLSMFCKWEKRGSERWSRGTGIARIQIQIRWFKMILRKWQ